MNVLKYIFLILFGIGGGVTISAGVFALITTIGIVPRMAEKTETQERLRIYESAISVGGILGTLEMYSAIPLPVGGFVTAVFFLCVGVFVGELAVSIAEVINVFPIFMRRARLTKGLTVIITAIALGKSIGSYLYFTVNGFY